ncbi:MAG: photosystem II oxygen evolving complex protein PsbP [Merismopedia sp. SIO2A8]|nr:photosystem II oxygen evolving complex protein PsbP [Merismopedia sp. SIO2A8]
MLKRLAIVVVMILGITLQGCVSGTAGLKSYVDSYDGYEFLYPNGWVNVKVENGPDVVLHDLVDPSENVSVILSDVSEDKTLADLGTPSEVGQRLANRTISSAADQRKAELISAEAHDSEVGPYYILEYVVELPGMVRHNLASVVVRRGHLFTLNVSTTESRWQKTKNTLRQVVNSFSVY